MRTGSPNGLFRQMLSTSGVSLDQAALHEIGHALGLADNTDPQSIMFPELAAANATLDASDLRNIQALYGPGTNALAGANAPTIVQGGAMSRIVLR